MEQTEETDINNEKDNLLQIQQYIYLAIFFVISMIVSIVFLIYYFDWKKVSKLLFVFCFFYYTLLLFYLFVTNYDLIIGYNKDEIDVDKMKYSFLFIEYYYKYFNYFGYFLRFIFFPIFIKYSKSGYLNPLKKILDGLILHMACYHILKLLLFIIIIIPGGILFIIYLNVLIDLDGKYGLLNYLNFLSLIEIYMNIGFFIVHTIIDTKRKCNKDTNEKYYKNFKKYVNDKINNDNEKMEKAYYNLCKEIPNIASNKLSNNYYEKLSSLINEAKKNEYKDIYRINFDNIEINLLFKSKITEEENDKSNQLINNENNLNQNLVEIKTNENNGTKENKNLKCCYNRQENQLSYHIRKFKKCIRKIPKLKFLIDKVEKEHKPATKCQNCLLYLKYIIYYFAVIIIIVFDSLCLKYKDKVKPEKKDGQDPNRPDTTLEFILAFLISFLFIFCNSSYTIAVIYSIYKRKIITDDLIYGKHSGDNLNLINTTKAISGLVTVLAYCNLYWYYYYFDIEIILFQVVQFPNFNIGLGLNFMGVIKFSFLIIFGILSNSFEKIFGYKINDFGNSCKYLS